MSADRQRLTSAIRRIAKTDPAIRDLLKAADSKGGKPGSAGVGSSTDAESQRICCDGSVSDNANPGTEARDTTDGDQDGLDPNDPANLGGLDGGSLTGVADCATGEPICFDGDGFIPPDGWDEPSDPPADDTWREGFYVTWFLRVGGVVRGSGSEPTPAMAFAAYNAVASNYCMERSMPSWFSGCTSSGTIISGTAGTGACNSIPSSYAYSFSCNSCSGQPECDYTAEDPPTLEAWPSDGCVNLAVKGGTIVGSKYDPENNGSYSAPRSSIDLCDGNGNQISLAPAANGGWKTINSTTNNGYLYDSSGKQIAHIDGNEYSDPAI